MGVLNVKVGGQWVPYAPGAAPYAPWMAVTFAAGWKNYAGFQPCQYRKIGDIVYFRGLAQIDNSFGTPLSTIFVLPAEFRAPGSILMATAVGEPNATARMEINSDGTVTAGTITSVSGAASAGTAHTHNSAALPLTNGSWVSLSNISFSVTP